jgi:hypothetical protein
MAKIKNWFKPNNRFGITILLERGVFMGSWNETCGLSNLAIEPREEVVFLLITQSPYEDVIGKSGCYHTDFFFPRTIPLYGMYDDYGRVAFHEGQDKIIDLIKRGFELDLIPVDAENKFDTAVSMEDWSMDNLQEWLHDGKVRINKGAIDWAVDPSTTGPSPVYKLIIRRDVWEAFCSTSYTTWDGTNTLDLFKNSADRLIEFLASETFTVDMNKSRRNPVHFTNLSLAPDKNSFMSIYNNVISSIPFTISARWSIEQIVEQFSSSTLTESEAKDMFYRLAEMAHVEKIMMLTRRAWMPTVGMGSQGTYYKLSLEIFNKLTKVAEPLRKKAEDEGMDW